MVRHKEAIHSGHFMVSNFEAEAQDDEEDIAVPVSDLGPNHLVETSANFWGWEVLQYSLLLSSRCLRKRKVSTYQRQTENKRMSKVASREFSF